MDAASRSAPEVCITATGSGQSAPGPSNLLRGKTRSSNTWHVYTAVPLRLDPACTRLPSTPTPLFNPLSPTPLSPPQVRPSDVFDRARRATRPAGVRWEQVGDLCGWRARGVGQVARQGRPGRPPHRLRSHRHLLAQGGGRGAAHLLSPPHRAAAPTARGRDGHPVRRMHMHMHMRMHSSRPRWPSVATPRMPLAIYGHPLRRPACPSLYRQRRMPRARARGAVSAVGRSRRAGTTVTARLPPTLRPVRVPLSGNRRRYGLNPSSTLASKAMPRMRRTTSG